MKKMNISGAILACVAFASSSGHSLAAQGRGNHSAASVERLCASETGKAEREGKMSEAMTKHLRLTDLQKSALKDFEDARAKSIEAVKTRMCATKPDLSTFEARLAFHQAFLEDRLEAVKAENPKLIAFYNSLDAEQKAKFDKIREHLAHRRDR